MSQVVELGTTRISEIKSNTCAWATQTCWKALRREVLTFPTGLRAQVSSSLFQLPTRVDNHFISLIPTIVPSETPAATHSIPDVVSPVTCPRKVLKTESSS